MTVDYAKIGPHLRAIRKQRGESTQDVAERIAMQQHVLRAIEAGEKQPSIQQLHLLARAYGVRLEIGIGAHEHQWVSGDGLVDRCSICGEERA